MAAQHRTPIGARFERLTVTGEPFRKKYGWYVPCRCDCGVERIVRCGALLGAHTKSCGCFNRDKALKGIRRTHGLSQTGAWRSYHAMLTRCYNEKIPQFKDYGGRGIRVCDRWLSGFEAFFEDMGERPDGMSLDRWPDVNGNYEPGNCRWATDEEQHANMRNSSYLEFQGQKKTVSQWAKITGFDRAAIEMRMKLGWSVHDALTVPPEKGRNQYNGGELLTFQGKSQTTAQWAAEIGISYSTLKRRFYMGWSIEKALTQPLEQHKRRD
jgi:hypothetical protein